MDLMSAKDILELGQYDVAALWATVAVEQEAVRALAAKVVLEISLEGLGDCDRSTDLQRKALKTGVLTIIETGRAASWSVLFRDMKNTYPTDVESRDRSFEMVVVGAWVVTVSA